ncbi:hypothetical protein [Modicisalibacter xianhensis]|uniref:Uncharacterized protein n=1 Tax=Modicisalibacter xianhensis TaxID=442341 RepID=A0A1I2ZY00_9GAMM|nr:hypothetical protein [Halomonas xianhensis]SFH42713.1 hypothetical protein SAMN04487959_1049 [Halomonas xianhensis]
MNRIFLLLALIVGIASAYVVLKPSEEQEQAQGSWNLYEELDRDAAANRPGWR